MFSYISEWFSDPKGMLMLFLLALPGRLLAICGHEAAHAFVAWKCGDPTAKYMGRLTLNPMKHLDPIGTVMILILGFGWAKPVPVNPLNFRNYRRDDLLVSLAGITANLLMALCGIIVMYITVAVAIGKLPEYSLALTQDTYLFERGGERLLISGGYWYRLSDIIRYAVNAEEWLIVPALGQTVGYIYQMLVILIEVNLALAVFNLLPIPPLDGYHVLNDMILKKQLFASRRVSEIATCVTILLVLTGVIGKAINYVLNFVLSGAGSAAVGIFGWMGTL